MSTILRTQKETDAWLAEHVKIGKGIEATFAPEEPIDLSYWIGAYECCSHCGAATRGVRRGADGHPEEECSACGTGGFLITTWGEEQTERWREGERYDAQFDDEAIDDDGPQVGPIVVVGGVPEHVSALLAQAKAEWVKSEDRRPHDN
jgi:hypothetical protein